MLKRISKCLNKKGFTLVELIVVLAVLGIIAAIAIPRFSGVEKNAKIKADEASLQIVKKAVEIYVISEDKTLPISTETDADVLVTNGYLDSVPKSQEDPTKDTVTFTVDEDGEATVTFKKKPTS